MARPGKVFLAGALVFGLGIFSAPKAMAGDLDAEGDFTFTTDYIFRGVTRSNSGPAFQGTFSFLHDSGFYSGIFVSNFQDSSGHETETELYLGYLFSKGAYDFNVAVSYDTFHGGGDSTGYFEFRGSVSRDFGLLYLTGGFAFTPDNREFGTGRSVYFYTAADFPIPIPSLPPTSLSMHVGFEDFAGGFSKWDWSVGLYTEIIGLEWGVKYTDTNRNFQGAGGNVLASLRGYF